MSSGRSACRQLAGVAALAAAVSLGVAAPGGAESRSAAAPGQTAGLQVSAGAGGQEVELDLLPGTAPLPRKLVLQVPAGYKLDLSAVPGTTVASMDLTVVGVDSPSFATASGPLVVQDPANYATDPAAQACAPGIHAAVWSASTPIAGQQVDFTFFVDPGDAPGLGATLQACPTGLAGGSKSTTSISIDGLAAFISPTAPGTYLWHAYVTPAAGPAYEVQAVVPLPETVTIRGRYDKKTRSAVLTGRVLEAGKPVRHASLSLTGTSVGGNGGVHSGGQTKADGSFAIRARIKVTTDFEISVSTTSGSCEGASTAPGGCLGSQTVPPDDGYTTVWVSVPGGAVRALRAADQRQAERANLTGSDFAKGFMSQPIGGDPCANPAHESDLTITGESMSPAFVNQGDGDSPVASEALGIGRVYATSNQARSAFAREAVVATVQCEFRSSGLKKPKISTLSLHGLPARVRAFGTRVAIGEGLVADVDFVFLQRGRGVETLRFVLVGVGRGIERAVAERVAARMR